MSLTLPDGTALRLERIPRRWWSVALRDDLLVDRQGVPVPGSDGDPRTIGRRAARLIALFGVLVVLSGLLWQLFARTSVPATPLFLEGSMLLVLGGVAMFGLRLPILLAALLVAADTLAVLVLKGQFAPTALVVRALFVVQLVRSWKRMDEI